MDKSNAVLSLRVVKGKYDYCKPYRDCKEKSSRGSGFILDIKEGIVVTNFHVIENAISINGRLPSLGQKDISLCVLGTCREKDVALLKINDLNMLADESIPSLKFADSMMCQPGEPVIALGYPYDSERVKMTTGIFSGMGVADITSDDNKNGIVEKEDSYNRPPTYLQISAPINPGYSGGPLLNYKGEVIGINSAGYEGAQNIGYAIPSRVFAVIFPQLLKNLLVKMPNAGFSFCSTNRELMKCLTGTSSTYGIYVTSVDPDTCFDLLEKGDIIRRLDYRDIFWKISSKDSSKEIKGKLEKEENFLRNFTDGDLEKGTLVTVFFDRFGLSTKIGKLKNPDEVDDDKLEFEVVFTDRKMNLNEIMDIIPIGTELTLNICRLGRNEDNKIVPSWYKLNTKYTPHETNKERIRYALPGWSNSSNSNSLTTQNFEIFAGCCFMNLCKQHFFSSNGGLNIDSSKDFTKYHVIISHIFPDSSVAKTQSLYPGNIVTRLCGYNGNWELETEKEIYTLEDVKNFLHCIKKKNLDKLCKVSIEYLQIHTSDDRTCFVSVNIAIQEDISILKNFNVRCKYFFE